MKFLHFVLSSCQLRDRQVQPDQLVPLANQVYLDAVATTVTTDFLVALEPLDHQAREVTKVVVVLMANRAPLDKDDVADLANVDIQVRPTQLFIFYQIFFRGI